MTPARIAILIAFAAAIAFVLWPANPPPPPPPDRIQAPVAPPPVAEVPKFPVPPPPEPAPLPPLKESDPALLEALARTVGAAALEKFFHLEDVVRRIVATVDNLPREEYAQRLNPVKPIEGRFAASGRDATLAIAPENTARYAPFVSMVEALGTTEVVATYLHFYPLFQQAYLELGYPKGYFNDRLVEVIDHLLATPEIALPIALVQPKVMYEFEDPAIESRSAGQKALIRMGPENAARLKAKLRELREELLTQSRKR